MAGDAGTIRGSGSCGDLVLSVVDDESRSGMLDTTRWQVVKIDAAQHQSGHIPIAIHSFLAEGSYGRVYRATWGGQVVAVKVIKHDLELLPLVQREADVLMSMHHPNVVSAMMYVSWQQQQRGAAPYDGGVQDLAQTWIVQEFCDGGSLWDFVHFHDGLRDGPTDCLNMRLVLDLLVDIARALQYMHANLIIHGDLKSRNVLLVQSGERLSAKVIDFGLSRRVALGSYVHTRTMGTISHMSPEMLRDGHKSFSGDVYAFGMIMYETLTGCAPFYGLSCSEVVEKVLAKETPEVPPGMPQLYVDTMLRCWHDEPQERPTFAQLLQSLDGIQADSGTWQSVRYWRCSCQSHLLNWTEGSLADTW